MTTKAKFFLSLVCIHLSGTSLTMRNIDESKVKSFVVERRRGISFDYFTVNMKTNQTCTEGFVHEWCNLFHGYQDTSKGNKSSCSCQCFPPFYTIIPPMQTCINVTRAALFGDCGQYYNRGRLFEDHPVNLAIQIKPNFSPFPKVGKLDPASCTLRGSYFDYSGFQRSWKNISDSFFKVNQQGNIAWNKDSDGKLSGRIIRLVVTCGTSQKCLLFKALGEVTYYAPESSSTSSTYQSVSTSHLASQLPLLSSTSSFVPGSLSSSSSHSQILSVSSVSSQPSLSSVTSTPPTLSASSTTSPLPSPSSSLSSSPAQPPSPSLVMISSAVQSETPSSLVPTSSTAGNKGPGDSSKRTGGNNDGAVIGAAAGGALLVAILIIIILIFWKRRKAGKSTENQGKQVKNPVYAATIGNEIQLERPKGSVTAPSRSQDNLLYQGLVISNVGQSNGKATYSSPGDDYDNCTVYHNLNKQTPGSPVYQSLMIGKDEPAQTITKANPRANSTDATGIPKLKPGVTGQPSQRPSVTPEPVYNVLDESGSDQGTTTEDLYNVLEGPDSGNDYEDANADGLYHSLEGPNTTYGAPEVVQENPGPESTPMYPVLLGPDANQTPPASHDEPLYNVVEGPGSDDTNQPGPDKPCPAGGLGNPSYEQTLELDQPYATVQQPGTQIESLYQPLRGPTHDLYEALG